MTYEEALRYYEETAVYGSRLGLDRVRELLAKLGDPQKSLKFVHIAGTNGKGSTAAMLAAVLEKAGYRTGLYTSPHLLRYNERFQVNGKEIGDQDLADATERVKQAADTMPDAPTQFELVTAIAFCLFQAAKCDIVVLEVGLGGRLDATNVIDVPEAAVITRIGLDHTEILGDTVEAIAAEKAGIVKPGGAVVLGDQDPRVRGVVEQVCRDQGAALTEANLGEVRFHSSSLECQHFGWRQYPDIQLALLGEYQLQNACTVLNTVETLRSRGGQIPDEAVLAGLREVVWPGRFERVRRDPWLIIDGGHNPQCAQAIAASLREYFPGKKILFLMGVLADKDFEGIYDALLPLAERIYAVTPDSPRALTADKLCERLADEYHFTAAKPYGSVADALKAVLAEAGEKDVICVCGSLYMIGEARRELGLR